MAEELYFAENSEYWLSYLADLTYQYARSLNARGSNHRADGCFPYFEKAATLYEMLGNATLEKESREKYLRYQADTHFYMAEISKNYKAKAFKTLPVEHYNSCYRCYKKQNVFNMMTYFKKQFVKCAIALSERSYSVSAAKEYLKEAYQCLLSIQSEDWGLYYNWFYTKSKVTSYRDKVITDISGEQLFEIYMSSLLFAVCKLSGWNLQQIESYMKSDSILLNRIKRYQETNGILMSGELWENWTLGYAFLHLNAAVHGDVKEMQRLDAERDHVIKILNDDQREIFERLIPKDWKLIQHCMELGDYTKS